MTVVISRYFDSVSKARSVKQELVLRRRLSQDIVGLFEDTETLAFAQAHGQTKGILEAATFDAYQSRLASGGAVLIVAAGSRPLGVAKTTREVFANSKAPELDGIVEERSVKDPIGQQAAFYSGYSLALTRRRDPWDTTYHMADWPIPLISRRKPWRGSLVDRNGFFANWPIAHLLPGSKRYGRWPFDLLVPGNRYMAKFPFAHIVPGHRYMAKFPFAHIVPGHRFMAKFPFGHIIPGHKFQANFPFGHLVPGGGRMANWPFPLLINGERGKNALMPGEPYMAKFPFAHIVPGHRFMAKFPFAHIVPGHKFMAKFPFGHIIPGHKFQANFPFGHLVPGGGRMANWPFALLTKDVKELGDLGRNFTVSKFFGIPTLLSR